MSTKGLATIQKIIDVQPIPDADAIEVCSILGWKVVSKKGQFKPGSLCVYCQIDTVVPDKPEFEFMRKSGFRIKTIRLRKQLSQGIIFPLSVLPGYEDKIDGKTVRFALHEGDDVTELVGITKYEKVISPHMAGEIKGSFPGHIPKTDEIMLQNMPAVLDELRGKECYISVKCDGTSATFAIVNGEIHVCSRNWSLKESDTNLYWQMFKKYKLNESLPKFDNFAIQAEIVGPGIQKNRLGLSTHEIRVFQAYDAIAGKFLDYKTLDSLCKDLNLPMVQVDKVCTFDFTLEHLLDMAKGFYEGTNKNREGIVIRPTVETQSEAGSSANTVRGRTSFKVLNNDFLEKDE